MTLRRSDDVIAAVVAVTAVADVAVSRRGELAFLTRAPDGAVGLWCAGPGEAPRAVPMDRPPSGAPLAWSADGELLAYVASGGAELRVATGGRASRPVARVDGSIEAVRWSAGGRELLLLVLDPGGDTASPTGAVPSAPTGSGPVVRTPGSGMRRLVRAPLAGGALRSVALDVTVWEPAWRGDACVALVSADPTENGWYHAELVTVDLDRATVAPLYRSGDQLAAPVLSPDGRRVAFVEGLSSDRGLTPGRVRVVDLADRRAWKPLAAEDVTWVDWLDGERLLYAGWRGLATVVGELGLDGTAADRWHGPATVGLDHRPQVAIGGELVAGVVETDGVPQEVCALEPGSGWRPRSRLNAGLTVSDALEVGEASWDADDGLRIESLVWRPADGAAGPLVVLAHGGPSLAWTHAHSPCRDLAAPLTAAGCTVLLPNPRGGTGRGEAFARANVGDLGGGDYRDLVRGVEWARRELYGGAPVPAGLAGASYGGFLAAWAGADGGDFAAAVAMAVISNWLSYELTSANGKFVPVFLGGPESELTSLYRSRSPVTRAGPGSVPTLVIQGELDQCTPPSQGVELYNALRRAGAETELVVYPGEGHAPKQVEYRTDLLTRSRGWLLRHVTAG